MAAKTERRESCCAMGKCPCCDCCICICTKELKNILSPEVRKLLIEKLR